MREASKVTALTHKIFITLFPGTIAIGYLMSAPLFGEDILQYSVLNIISLISISIAAHHLLQKSADQLPVLIAVTLIVTGYFGKFYILCFMSLNRELFDPYLIARFPLENPLLGNNEVTRNYFIHLTVYASALSLLAFFTSKFARPISTCTNRRGNTSDQRLLIAVSIVTIASAFVVLCIWYFQIGTVNASAGAPLPFRLAGVIQAANSILLPMAFLALILMAEDTNSKYLFAFAIAAMGTHALAAGFITTSKTPLVTVWISLLLMWVIQQKLDIQKAIGLGITLPLVLGYSKILGAIRRTTPTQPEATSALSPSIPSFTPVTTTPTDPFAAEGIATTALQLIDTVLRVGGADSYLSIIKHTISRTISVATPAPPILNQDPTKYFNQEVLGITEAVSGTSFSPSLIGYFYILSPNVVITAALLTLFILSWQWIYSKIRSSRLATSPAILSLLMVTLAFSTSEGTLEALPQRLGLIAVCAATIEVAARFLSRANSGAKR